MPRIEQNLGVSSPKMDVSWLKELVNRLAFLWSHLATVFNGQLSFGNGVNSDNIAGAWISLVTPGVANTDITLTHGLGRVPVGYFVVKKSASCDVYDGSVAGTSTQITLRATVVGVNLLIFVI